MYRIDNATAVPAIPVPAAVGPNPDHYFTKGNPGSGIPATIVDDDWANAIQEEIAYVIEQSGIALNKTVRTQLHTAIQNMIQGGDYKASVRVASTAAINLAAPGANIDGVAMVAGDRFLEKDHATLALRGIYIWNGAAVAATRALDADNGTEFNGGAIIPVEQGTVNADTNWQLTNDGVVTIGASGLTFTLLANYGLKASNIFAFTATGAISNTWAGATVLLSSAAAIIPTLPAASTVAKGLRYEFLNINTGVSTITRNGADTIVVNNNNVTSIAMGNGDTLTLESDGVSVWYAVAGSVQLKYASIMQQLSSLTGNGYRQLPAYPGDPTPLIIQWGTTVISAGANVPQAVNLPITFPTAGLRSFGSSASAASYAGATNISTTQITIFASNNTAGVQWIAIGY